MSQHVDRKTVNLSAYPDLVVIYLGMRVRTLFGVKTLLGLDRRSEGRCRPEGFRLSGAVGPVGTAPDLVAELPARFRRYRLLA